MHAQQAYKSYTHSLSPNDDIVCSALKSALSQKVSGSLQARNLLLEIYDSSNANIIITLREGTLGCLWYVQRSRQIVTGPRADYGLAKTKQKVIKKPCNKLLTNRASSSRTGEYWPWVVFVRTLLRSVRTATTSGQYFPGSTALALG